MTRALQIHLGQFSDRGAKTTNDDFYGALIPEGETPVSYTHLDVYKRQDQEGTRRWLLTFLICLQLLFSRRGFGISKRKLVRGGG